MDENEQIIRTFISAWSRLDPLELAGFFTEDGCYYNMPAEPVRGRDNVRAFIASFTATWKSTEWDIVGVASSGDRVYAERVDRIQSEQGDVALPCLGVFELRDGKIAEWRDYFDLNTYVKAMSG